MFITNIINRVPIERVLFPPPDNTKALEGFVTSMGSTQNPKEAPISEKPTSTIARPPPHPELPTPEETTSELKRRLAKELYRAELDLSGGLRIAGKPCDCRVPPSQKTGFANVFPQPSFASYFYPDFGARLCKGWPKMSSSVLSCRCTLVCTNPGLTFIPVSSNIHLAAAE